MNKLRILQVITKADWAGAQRVVYEICKYIKDNHSDKIEIEVAVGENGLLVHKLAVLGIRVHILNWLQHDINPIIDYKGYKEIKKTISIGRYDVVHCHSTKAGILGRLAAYRLNKKRIIYTVHGLCPILQYNGIERKAAILIERMLEKLTTDMVFLSMHDIEMAKQFKIYHPQKINLIYNSLTVPEVTHSTLRLELSINPDVKIIGNVARVDEVKNPIRFIEIAKEYYYLYPKENTAFVWIGDGPLMNRVASIVERYGLTDKVFFIGFRDKVEQYMSDFDLLLMTSICEGMPQTILEAIELNVPILSADVGGICEMIGKKNVYRVSETNQDIAKKLNDTYTRIYLSDLGMAEKYVNLYLSDRKGI